MSFCLGCIPAPITDKNHGNLSKTGWSAFSAQIRDGHSGHINTGNLAGMHVLNPSCLQNNGQRHRSVSRKPWHKCSFACLFLYSCE